MIETPLPSHITIKYPFKTNNLKNLEKTISTFVKQQKVTKFCIKDFGKFRKFVIFLKPTPLKAFSKIQKQLREELRKSNKIPNRKFDKKFEPHATIGYGNTKESFNKMWSYVKTLKKPKFNLKFDNLTILKKPGRLWKIHKVFEIK